MRGRDKLRRQPRALAEEKLLHLFHQELLRRWCPRLQPVLIQQHLLPVYPLAPRLLGHVLENLLAELRVEGRLFQALHLLFVANAKDGVRHKNCPQMPLYWAPGSLGLRRFVFLYQLPAKRFPVAHHCLSKSDQTGPIDSDDNEIGA